MSATPRLPARRGPSISRPSMCGSSLELLAEQDRILALGLAPTLVPGLEVHPQLQLVDVATIAVVDRVAQREGLVAEPLGQLDRGDVVRGETGRCRARVDDVEDPAAEGQRRIRTEALVPALRIDREVRDVDVVRSRLDVELDAAAAGERTVGLYRPQHRPLVLGLFREALLPRGARRGLVPVRVRERAAH